MVFRQRSTSRFGLLRIDGAVSCVVNWLEDASENTFTRFALCDNPLSNNRIIIARLFFEVKKVDKLW